MLTNHISPFASDIPQVVVLCSSATEQLLADIWTNMRIFNLILQSTILNLQVY